MRRCFALVLILIQISISRKEASIFSVGKGSHSASCYETNPFSLLMGKGRKRDAAMEDNVGVFSLDYF